jgi:hypothetical protein
MENNTVPPKGFSLNSTILTDQQFEEIQTTQWILCVLTNYGYKPHPFYGVQTPQYNGHELKSQYCLATTSSWK